MCSRYATLMNDYSIVYKAYLDARLQGLDAIYVNETGDTMEGDIDMGRHKLTNLKNPRIPQMLRIKDMLIIKIKLILYIIKISHNGEAD